MLIEGSNNEISRYITVTYGKSGDGSYSCSSNKNGIFTNTNQLSRGNHTITCTAKGNSGLTKKDMSYLIVVNAEFIKNKQDDLVATFIALGDSEQRNYYKKNANISLAGLCNYTETYKWLGPVFVSNESDGTAYYTNGNYEAQIVENIGFTYLNQTWYVSPNAAFYPYDANISYTSLKNITTLKSVEYFDNEIECAKTIIDLAIQN